MSSFCYKPDLITYYTLEVTCSIFETSFKNNRNGIFPFKLYHSINQRQHPFFLNSSFYNTVMLIFYTLAATYPKLKISLIEHHILLY